MTQTSPRTFTITLTQAEAEEVMFALKLRRHQKRTPYPGIVENVWRRCYEGMCALTGQPRDHGATCYDNSIRVSIVGRERW